MGQGRRLAILVVGLALNACTSRAPGGAAPSDESRIASDVARRTGAAPFPGVPDAQPCADPVVDGLLARPLTQESAVRIALLNNRSVRESYERLGVARADLLQAGLLSNPVFTADAKFFSAGPEIELGLTQSFIDLFFLPLRKRVARADLLAEEAAVSRDLVGLVYDVRRAFVAVHAADQLVELRQEAHRAAVAARDLMLKLHAAGNAPDTRRTLEEVSAARAQLELDAAAASARDAREPLNVLLGLTGKAVRWSIEGDVTGLPGEPSAAGVEERARTASLDLLENCARIQAALFKAGLVRKEGAWPLLDLGAVGKRESDGAWGFGPQISTTLPIFDQGQARFLAANATLRGRVAHHAQLTVEVEAAARRLAARATALRQRAEYLRDTYLPLRERLVEETLQYFNAMQIGAFDVLHAKEQELDAKRESAEVTRDAWLAALDLQELLAGSLNPARLEAMPPADEAEHPEVPKGH